MISMNYTELAYIKILLNLKLLKMCFEVHFRLYSVRQVSGTVNWSGTTLITFDMEVTGVIFDRNSVV